jgi:alkyl hydroperoxide reductase subunit AhpC
VLGPGRHFDEVVRVLDSLQLTAKHRVSTTGELATRDDVIIAGSVNNEEAKKIYPDGWKVEGAEAVHPHRAAA